MLASEAPARLQKHAKDGFELWYQPIYDIDNGSVLYNEVLLRWRDASGRLYLPHQFMSLVARSHQPGWLDRLVIRKAIQTLITYPTINLSINLSDQVFQDSELVDYLYAQLKRCHLHPRQLQFEISEQQIAGNLAEAISLIRDLRSIGCSVILDGFSNEYLTFLEWEKLNVSSIKVDGRLIQSASESWRQSQLTRTIVETSSLFEQSSVAKSIDVRRRSSVLSRLSFDSAQGYHFKPPSRHPWLVGKVDILGVPIDNLSQEQFLNQLTSGVVFTPNVDHLMNLRKDEDFVQAYNAADYKVCDSQVLFFASKLLGKPIEKRLSGSDLFPAFYHHHRSNPDMTIFLLGGTGRTAVHAQRNINHKVGRQMVVDTYTPSMGFDQNEQECQEIVDRINHSGAKVLAVGVGSPKQETWIYRYQDQLPDVQIIFAIGATIAFEAGTQTRSPEAISNMGLEWLHRLITEPRRLWKRYLINDMPFVWLLLQQKFSQS